MDLYEVEDPLLCDKSQYYFIELESIHDNFLIVKFIQ